MPQDRLAHDPPTVRAQDETDWPAVLAILDEVAREGGTYAMEVPGSPKEGRDFWSGEHLAVVEVMGRVVGAAKMGPNRPAQGSHVGTASFIVAGSARGHGVGRALGEYAVGRLRVQGYAAIQFNAVVESNLAAVRLWHSLGFTTVGTVPEAFLHPSGELVGLHVMHLSLAAPTALQPGIG